MWKFVRYMHERLVFNNCSSFVLFWNKQQLDVRSPSRDSNMGFVFLTRLNMYSSLKSPFVLPFHFHWDSLWVSLFLRTHSLPDRRVVGKLCTPVKTNPWIMFYFWLLPLHSFFSCRPLCLPSSTESNWSDHFLCFLKKKRCPTDFDIQVFGAKCMVKILEVICESTFCN